MPPYASEKARFASMAEYALRRVEELTLAEGHPQAGPAGVVVVGPEVSDEEFVKMEAAWLAEVRRLDKIDRQAHADRVAARGTHKVRHVDGKIHDDPDPEPVMLHSPIPPRPVRPRKLSLEERMKLVEEFVAQSGGGTDASP